LIPSVLTIFSRQTPGRKNG